MAHVIDLRHRPGTSAATVSVFFGLPEAGQPLLIESLVGGKPQYRFGVVTDPSPAIEAVLGGDECPRCDFEDRLLEALHTEIDQNSPDYIFMQASPDCDPALVAESLTAGVEESDALRGKIKLDALITVIDARRFLIDFASDVTLGERYPSLPLTPSAQSDYVIDLLAEGIEFCDIIVLTHCSVWMSSEIAAIETLLKRLQPRARIVQIMGGAEAGMAEIGQLLDTNLFSAQDTLESCAWKQALTTPGELDWVYQRRRPFHPERFHQLIENWPEGLIRTLGQAWLASRNDDAFTLSQIGPTAINFVGEGKWVASLPDAERTSILNSNPELREHWNPWFGDRQTEIVFIAEIGFDRRAWETLLDSCLLTDQEMRAPWSELRDPFPTEPEEHEGDAPPAKSRRPQLRLIPSPPPL